MLTKCLVNGLWQAGAEAISINGQRLTSTSAIRFAGQAILVDPGLKLVVVHMAVAKNPTGNEAFARERDALFRGIVARYGSW